MAAAFILFYRDFAFGALVSSNVDSPAFKLVFLGFFAGFAVMPFCLAL
jgi:hypothetical protein